MGLLGKKNEVGNARKSEGGDEDRGVKQWVCVRYV